MEIRDVYEKFGIPPNLQEHMTQVFGVVSFIAAHWKNKNIQVDWDLTKKIALLHDLGNIVKFDLDRYPEFFGTEQANIEQWREKQKQIIETYGFDDRAVTSRMLREIVVSQDAIEVIESKGFGNASLIEASHNWLLKILFYADMRVLPQGVGPLQERIKDIGNRLSKYSKRADFGELCAACVSIERQIQTNLDVSVLDVDDSSIEVRLEKILKIDISGI